MKITPGRGQLPLERARIPPDLEPKISLKKKVSLLENVFLKLVRSNSRPIFSFTHILWYLTGKCFDWYKMLETADFAIVLHSAAKVDISILHWDWHITISPKYVKYVIIYVDKDSYWFIINGICHEMGWDSPVRLRFFSSIFFA